MGLHGLDHPHGNDRSGNHFFNIQLSVSRLSLVALSVELDENATKPKYFGPLVSYIYRVSHVTIISGWGSCTGVSAESRGPGSLLLAREKVRLGNSGRDSLDTCGIWLSRISFARSLCDSGYTLFSLKGSKCLESRWEIFLSPACSAYDSWNWGFCYRLASCGLLVCGQNVPAPSTVSTYKNELARLLLVMK